MAQTYFPARKLALSPTQEKDSNAAGFAPSHAADIVAHVADVQEAYVDQKNRLVTAIDATRSLLTDVRAFNKDSWIVRYPQLAPKSASTLVRSMSFADEPTTTHDVMVAAPKHPLQRSLTLASLADAVAHAKQPETEDLSSEFSVLRLDLKMGPAGGPAALVSQLEKASIANLVDERVQASMVHMDKLRTRVEDTSSKVLVTGDLNAGKSTFVNALLRRDAMPVDQQPCTSLFCEVHDAAENHDNEEVHVVVEGKTYNINDEATFSRRPIADLDKIVTESDVHHTLKVYLSDERPQHESLLRNGVVDISLIDAPGLNTDSLKTTAVFARQEEIDVVVFVVSAENHFTLSAQDFLFNASNEKAYLFIVVNKYDQIRDKERCRRRVLEQIKKLSPRTWDDAEDLVHFVDSSAPEGSESFGRLESALRNFVLVKRAKSKLLPVTTYLTNVLADVDLLASANSIVANNEAEQAKADLDRTRPVLEKMKAEREALEDGLESVEDERTRSSGEHATAMLSGALSRVAQGELALASNKVVLPSYPGLLNIWDYVVDVRKALLASVDLAVKAAEDEARVVTTQGVNDIAALGDKFLPADVERSRRVFMPEAMFSPRKRPDQKQRRVSAARAQYGLGLGLAHRAELLEPTLADVFDVQHYLSVHFGNGHGKTVEDEENALGVLSLASVGVGALTVAGGKALGARGLLEAGVRLSELLGDESSRRWIAPVLGGLVLAGAAYLVLELPASVPRTVGRRISAALEADKWEAGQRERVERETRKVLRLASWDVRERFRGAMEERGRAVKGAEEMRDRALKAVEWFTEVGRRTVEVREMGGLGLFTSA
ncbi:hypothetical protein AURDEDRAFT_116211 [Auricularia subglabra TFB-10046 SS5]|nr:hypothetical protein AURDEDRAFT_116211 [Auricularia subglabra TFB-10046 SS5]